MEPETPKKLEIRSITFSGRERMRTGPKDLRTLIFEYLELILSTLAAAVLIKLFLLGSYSISLEEMANTLLPGDRLLANRAAFRIAPPFSKTRGLKIGDIRQNQIVVFRNPENQDKLNIMRCVAAGGRTIEIKDKQLFIDSVPYLFPPTLSEKDTMIVEGRYLPRDNMPPIRIPARGETVSLKNLTPLEFGYLETLIRQENPQWDLRTASTLWLSGEAHPYYDLSDYSEIDAVRHPIDGEGKPMSGVLQNCPWMEVNNILQFVMSKHPEQEVKFENHFILDGDTLESYTVKTACVFVMGDNWDKARDSRYFGFLSERSVVAKALVIYWSRSTARDKGFLQSIRWKRIALFL